jgi:prepilin-type N-terminal cleavage/methylation domain-containing protein
VKIRKKVESREPRVEGKRNDVSFFYSRPSTLDPRPAFTLIELLVVIAILGILAGLAVPALKNLGKSNANLSASRQLLDDLAHARALAISGRTTVYMVFVPTNFWGGLTAAEQAMPLATNLVDKQLTGYTFISYGALGDQPGQHEWHYLAPWQNLPEGSFIAAQKFAGNSAITDLVSTVIFPIYQFPYITNTIPFPTPTNFHSALPYVLLPYVAFNYQGQLISGRDEYIPLAQGSVGYGINSATKAPQLTTVKPGDITENPPGNSTGISYNIIHIDALTGRAVLEFHKIGP